MEYFKTLLPAIIGYMLVNFLVYGEPRGWAGVIGAGIFGGLAGVLFDKE